jgi:hypothetical protein
MKRKAKTVEENFKHEQESNSRLFVIDAGLDLEQLRAAYPDRARYAIVHGLIRPTTMREKNEIRVGGNISELHADSIHVPLEYSPVFKNPAAYEVTLAFGQRLEPWVVAASRIAATNK